MSLPVIPNIMGPSTDFPFWALVLAFSLILYLLSKPSNDPVRLDVPTVRFSRFIPDSINRFLYFVGAPYLINYGYKKYKDSPYRLLKPDADLIVLPAKYLPEMRQLPYTKLSLLDAQFNSVLGEYTNILNESNLPAHTVAKRLTPALNRIIPKVIDELQHAFRIVVPKCNNEWVPVNLYDMILNLINRATSRVIVGDVLCRSDPWLNTITSYTHNLGITIILLRPVPRFLRPFVAKLLPSVRFLDRKMKWVKEKVFVPMILARREAEKNNPGYTKPDDFMQWMMETASSPFDKEPENIAQGLMIIMALAVVHTSTMLITHGLYDLMIRPQYLAPLREEILDTMKHGWANATQPSFSAQLRLDSFLRESQRFNPTGQLSIQRIAKETIIFSDGFVLPKGTHICFPGGPIARDPDFVPNPEVFDGFRWCRDSTARNMSLVSISEANLHFGYGRQACPGRFFAVNTSKAILSRLLVEYDLKFQEDQEGKRPRNITNGEQIMPNFHTKVLIKKRGVSI